MPVLPVGNCANTYLGSREILLVVRPHTLHRPKLFPSITASSGQIRNIEVCQRRRAELT